MNEKQRYIEHGYELIKGVRLPSSFSRMTKLLEISLWFPVYEDAKDELIVSLFNDTKILDTSFSELI